MTTKLCRCAQFVKLFTRALGARLSGSAQNILAIALQLRHRLAIRRVWIRQHIQSAKPKDRIGARAMTALSCSF